LGGRLRRTNSTLVALVLAAALVSFAAAANEESEAAFQRGVARYEAGDHDEAAAAFQHAYQLDPKPIYLFSLAQSEVGRDRCLQANEIFRRYLKTDPPEANQHAAESRIRFCEERLAAAPPPEPVTSATPAESSATPSATAPPTAAPSTAAPSAAAAPTTKPTAPPQQVDAPASWWTDPLAMGLMAAGLAATGVGTGVIVWGQGSTADARDQAFADYQTHDNALEDGNDRRIAGGVIVGVGAAMVIGGVIRAIVVGQRASNEDAASDAQLWFGPGAVGGRF